MGEAEAKALQRVEWIQATPSWSRPSEEQKGSAYLKCNSFGASKCRYPNVDTQMWTTASNLRPGLIVRTRATKGNGNDVSWFKCNVKTQNGKQLTKATSWGQKIHFKMDRMQPHQARECHSENKQLHLPREHKHKQKHYSRLRRVSMEQEHWAGTRDWEQQASVRGMSERIQRGLHEDYRDWMRQGKWSCH